MRIYLTRGNTERDVPWDFDLSLSSVHQGRI